MRNEAIEYVWKFKKIEDLGVSHFRAIYKELDRANIAENLKLSSYFPSFVSYEDNHIEIYKDELLVALLSFKRDKISGPNEWIVEFLIDFYDLVGEDSMRVLAEVAIISKVLGENAN
jgi:hypothetical protein